MNLKKQFFLYILFAVLSTLINIGVQKLIEIIFINFIQIAFFTTPFTLSLIVIKIKLSWALLIQMAIATITAFVFKYIVDKLVIFQDKTSYFSKNHFVQVFFYGLFAVFTTFIFWGTEIGFKNLVPVSNSEYIGAVIGLAIGYTLKFILDRKYVFNTNDEVTA